MPLNVRRFCNFIALIFTFSFVASAQTPTATTTATPIQAKPTPAPTQSTNATTTPPKPAPSAADVMRERVAKAKAFIAVKNYNAAIYELENIRRETSDQSVQSVINVLLINSFVEQGDYKRAQDFLGDLAKAQKANKPNAAANYFAAAGQVVRGARVQLERYKSLGLNTADRNLPKEAASDVQKMRETLETVVEQSKVIGADKKQTADAMALLEEATNARSSLARDDYDAKRWKDEVADARETLANSQSVILNAAGDPTTTEPPKPSNVAAANVPPANQNSNVVNNPSNATTALTVQNNQTLTASVADPPVVAPKQTPVETTVALAQTENKPGAAPSPSPAPVENTNAQNRDRRVENANAQTTSANQNQNAGAPANANDSSAAMKNAAPMQVGSLVEYATQKTNPIYPPTAKTIRASGIVRVELTIDENGQVAEVQKASGPSILQRAATDAVKKWRFKPFVRDGEKVRAVGFVNFNFSL